ncbi:putative amidotransferase-domain-containing protein [Paraphoma chrysanthemicola]|uniref:Amidotransferase-domain-containing protein n=1 Tax=Paraphoma chrysanthemicola TaxID=798071 RepID=A0A8K0W4W6_9PLEO|nr:putative amidotransferase-domain-containing protein [Paraphoma chrysanthemicola]
MPSPPRSYTAFPSQADLFYSCTTSSTSAEDLNLHYAPASKTSLKIGVVILSQDQTQILDLAALDLLAMVGRARLSRMNASASAIDEAVDEIDIRYVTSSGEGSFPVTSGGRIPVTNSFENSPQFDILLVPGSFSTSELSVSATSFLSSQYANPAFIAIFSIVSGILHLVQTGILHKRRAAAPRCLLPALRVRYPETSWRSTPWERHEKFWSSNSAVSALDMVRTFMREYFWDRTDAVECALNAAGIGSLDEYE